MGFHAVAAAQKLVPQQVRAQVLTPVRMCLRQPSQGPALEWRLCPQRPQEPRQLRAQQGPPPRSSAQPIHCSAPRQEIPNHCREAPAAGQPQQLRLHVQPVCATETATAAGGDQSVHRQTCSRETGPVLQRRQSSGEREKCSCEVTDVRLAWMSTCPKVRSVLQSEGNSL